MKSEDVKRLEDPEVKRFFPDEEMQTAVLASVGLIRQPGGGDLGNRADGHEEAEDQKGVRQAHDGTRYR